MRLHKPRFSPLASALLGLSLCFVQVVGLSDAAAQQNEPGIERPLFPGMDESVNEALAEEAGVPSRDPLIDTEAMGELWNLLLLVAGGVCGFLLGRHWDQLWGRGSQKSKR
jgi:hypothetical protein